MRAQSFYSLTITIADVGYMRQKEFALKKIRCPTGTEGVEAVMHEVAAYRRFKCVFSLSFTSASNMTVFQAPQHHPIICVLSFSQQRMQVDPTAGFGSAARF